MDLKSYSKQLNDIYLVSNTPSFLFETMRKSNIVNDYLANLDEQELFKEFNERVSKPITNTSEIAELYAILIALSFKKGEDIQGFFKYINEKVKFEWFSKIAEYYLSQQITNDSFTYSANPPSHIDLNVTTL